MFAKRLAIFAIIFLALAGNAWAKLQLDYPKLGSNLTINETTTFPELVAYLFQFSIYLAAVIVFVSVIIGGLKWIDSAGSASKILDAKDQILSSFLGLIILLSAWLTLNVISPNMTVLSLSVKPLNDVEINPPKDAPSTQSSYLVLPVGQVLEKYIYGKEALKAMATNDVEAVANTSDSLDKVLDLMQELRNVANACQCGQSSCSTNCPCSGSCSNAQCDKQKIAQLSKQLQDEIKIARQEMDKFAYPVILQKDLQKMGTIMSLAQDKNVDGYYTFLGARNMIEGTKSTLLTDTQPFTNWDSLWRSNPADPLTFYVNKNDNRDVIKRTQNENLIMVDIPENENAPDLEFQKGDGKIALFKQWDQRWGNCWRGGDCSTCAMKRSGCADTSLTMIINYWYNNNANVKQLWENLVLTSNVPGNAWSTNGANCRNNPNNAEPDPYKVLYFMNQMNVNTSGGGWDEDNLASMLSKIGLKYVPLGNISLEKAKNFFDNGAGLVLYCKYYKRDARTCNGPTGCNHYIVPVDYNDQSQSVKINDPGWDVDYLSYDTYRYYECGGTNQYGEKSFLIYPSQP